MLLLLLIKRAIHDLTFDISYLVYSVTFIVSKIDQNFLPPSTFLRGTVPVFFG